jgi:hypothetical protein
MVCIVCVAMVDPMSDEAEGWVLVENRVEDGDDHDDAQWKCPEHATASDEWAHEQRNAAVLADALAAEPAVGENVEDDQDNDLNADDD